MFGEKPRIEEMLTTAPLRWPRNVFATARVQ